MKQGVLNIVKIEADEGKVFDWAVPHTNINEKGEEIVEHLYVKELYLSPTDTIDNYIEVDEEV